MKTTVKAHLLRSTLLAALSVATGAIGSAYAQQTVTTTTTEGPAADEKGDKGDYVVVTGSRIPVRDTTGSSPIVTVGSEQLQEIGTSTIETYLNSLPQLSPSLTKTNNNPTGGGAAFLDLRQLGASRGLVLVNGRRLVPGSSGGAVDVSILPGALVDRVELITGGASAVYGADAISGVVNFILKEDFEGLEANVQYGISDRDDGQEWAYNLITGGAYDGGRGHATFAASYTTRDPIGQSSRDFTKRAEYCDYSGCVPNGSFTTGDGTFSLGTLTPTQIASYQAYFAPRASGAGGNTWNPALIHAGQRLGFNPDGSLFVAGDGADGLGTFGYLGPNTPAATGDGWDPDSYFGYNFNPTNLLQSGLERTSFFTSTTYDLSDNIEFYGNALYSIYSSSNQLAPSPAAFAVPVATTTTFPTAAQALLTANGVTSITLARRTTDLGPRTYNFDTTAYQLTGGFRGDLPALAGNVWNYDVYASYGQYDNRIEYAHFPEANRIRAALQGCPTGSPIGPVGADGTTSPCVALNPFGANSLTPAMKEYIEAKSQFEITRIEQTNVVASLTGDLLQLPAGGLGFAIGGEYRDLAYSDQPSEGQQTGTLLGGNTAGPVVGGYDVWEAFAEVRAPILADLPFIKYLGVEGGFRRSEYSIDQSTDTYKYGGEYAPFEWLRFRALQQRAVRAPSLGELFATQAEGFPGVTAGNLDPCDKDSTQRTGPNAAAVLALCQAQSSQITATFDSIGSQYRTFSGGNPNLSPEVADSFTAGFVLTAPDFVPEILSTATFTVDYFNIEIENVISSVGFSTSLSRCFDPTYNPTFTNSSVYCGAISRDTSTGLLTSVGLNGSISQTNANLAAFKASGVDIAATWSTSLGTLGDLSFSTQGTWYDNQQFQNLPGTAFSDNFVGTIGDGTPGSTALPEWKWNTRLAWQLGDFNVSARWQFIDSLHDPAGDGCTDGLGNQLCINEIPSYSYFYLNGSWQVTDNYQIYGGIDNVFDKQPPKYESGFQYQTDPSTYDTIGRYFYVGARAKF